MRRRRRLRRGRARIRRARRKPIFDARDARVQSRQVAGEPLVAEAQQAQLRVCTAVDAVLQRRRGLLQNGTDLDQPRVGRRLAQRRERLVVVAAAEQRRAALGRGGRDQQVAGERRQLAEHRAHVLAAGVELMEQQQRRLGVALQNEAQHLRGLHVAREAEGVKHLLRADTAAGRGALI